MQIQCVCGQKYNVKEELLGMQVRCRTCGQHIMVTHPNAPVAQPVVDQSQPPQPDPFAIPQPHQPPEPFGFSASRHQPQAHPPAQQSPPQGFGGVPQHVPGTHEEFPSRPAPGARPKPIASGKPANFDMVNNGIRLIFGGVLIMVCLVLIAIPAVFILGPDTTDLIVGLGMIVGGLMSTIGYVMCIGVPEKSNCRPLIIGAVICGGLAFLAQLFANFLASSAGTAVIMSAFGTLLNAGATVFFFLFIEKLCKYVGDRAGAKESRSLLSFWVAIAISVIVIRIASVFLVQAGFMGGIIMIVLGLSLLVASIKWVIQFLNFMGNLEFRQVDPRQKRIKRYQ